MSLILKIIIAVVILTVLGLFIFSFMIKQEEGTEIIDLTHKVNTQSFNV